MKPQILGLVFLALLLVGWSFPNADSSQYNTASQDNRVVMNINTLSPIITSSDGISSTLDYEFRKINGEWGVKYCHQDIKNYELSKDKSEYESLKISSLGGSAKNLPSTISADGTCDEFYFEGKLGDTIKIGDNSTIISINASDVEFIVTPEYNTCSYFSCDSQIELHNHNAYDIVINSTDLFVEVNGGEVNIEFDYQYEEILTLYEVEDDNSTIINIYNDTVQLVRRGNSEENLEIIIEPNEQKIFTINTIFQEENTEYKYNVSLIYLGEEYKIDPYFNTTNTTFNNGTYNNTLLNESGYVQINDSTQGGYYISEIFDAGDFADWVSISYCGLGIDGFICNPPVASKIIETNLDDSSSTIIDYSGNGYDGTYNGALYQEDGIKNYSLGFDGTSDTVSFGDENDFTFGDGSDDKPFSVSVWVNRDIVGSFHTVFSKWDASVGTEEYNMFILNTGVLRVVMKDESTSGTIAFNSIDSFTNNQWYHIAYVYDGSETFSGMTLYIDGELASIVNDSSGDYIAMENRDGALILGDLVTGTSQHYYFRGEMDEFIMFNDTLNSNDVEGLYKSGLARLDFSVRSCNDPSCSGEAYEDISEDPIQNLSLFVNRYFQYQFLFNGTYPQLYNVSINYEILEAPELANCTVSSNITTCNDILTLSCDVRDDLEVDTVIFNYTVRDSFQVFPSNISNLFFYDITLDFYNIGNVSETFYFNWAFGNDTQGNSNRRNLSIPINYTCTLCNSSYSPQFVAESCDIDDIQQNTTYYTDDNSCSIPNPPPPANSSVNSSCNYCSESISLQSSPLEDCDIDTLTQNTLYYYEDANYDTCCAVTGLSSDCNILNETLYSNSTSIEDCSGLDCLYDDTPFLKLFDDKIPLLCTFTANQSYEFITYVKAEGEIVQTNPERQLIDRYGEYNSFKGEDGIVNLYYTSDNLRPDRNITVIVEGQQGLFYQELYVTPTYSEIYQAQDRMIWSMANIGWILGGIVFLLIVGVFVWLIARRFKIEVLR